MSAERSKLVASIVVRLNQAVLDAADSGKRARTSVGLASIAHAADIRDERAVIRLTIGEVAEIVADVVMEHRPNG